MQQVLFWVPIETRWTPQGIPVHGFGVMLVLALVAANWVAGRRAERQGIPKERFQDLILWIVLCGIVGARIVYMYQYRHLIQNPLLEFFQIWNGGIVFYGSALGGWIGYLLASRALRRLGVTPWQVGDILAPAIAIGLCLGRIGCFLNGCCYGNVAAPHAPGVPYPILTAPARDLVHDYQTLAGFAMDRTSHDARTVGPVEPASPAAQAGLLAGDVIVAVDGRSVDDYGALSLAFYDRPRGQKHVTLVVLRGTSEVTVGPFVPRTLPLIPTQVYESVTMILLFLLLLWLYPVRRFDGQVLLTLMMVYAVHRFFNEMLRNDTDPVAFGLTLSQNGSILIFAAGALLWVWRSHAPRAPQPAAIPQTA